jgi:hypothetical protein
MEKVREDARRAADLDGQLTHDGAAGERSDLRDLRAGRGCAAVMAARRSAAQGPRSHIPNQALERVLEPGAE